MSTYKRITKHPLRAEWHNAEWIDDYFGPHRYGVKFPNDAVTYPADQVEEAQLKTLWTHDVLEAVAELVEGDSKKVMKFLELVEVEYKKRWERDPEGGEGAVRWLRSMRSGNEDESIEKNLD